MNSMGNHRTLLLQSKRTYGGGGQVNLQEFQTENVKIADTKKESMNANSPNQEEEELAFPSGENRGIGSGLADGPLRAESGAC